MMKRHEIVEKRNSQAAIGLSSHCTGANAAHISQIALSQGKNPKQNKPANCCAEQH
jgi:hypothetical protein